MLEFEASHLSELEDRLASIEEILPGISDMLVEMQQGSLQIDTKTNAMDLVTNADRESEKAILSTIQSRFPRDAILAEESGTHAGGESQFTWAIDPVDGTINYAHGLPLYCISIGIMFMGTPVGGIVHMPALGTTYRAARGKGASCNGKAIRCTKTESIDKALVVTGFPYDRHDRLDGLLGGLRSALENVRGVRRTGSAALDMSWVAQGRFDAHYELSLNAWDTCAGIVLVTEAGGRVTNFRGDTHSPGDYQMLASNGIIHDDMLRVLEPMAHMKPA